MSEVPGDWDVLGPLPSDRNLRGSVVCADHGATRAAELPGLSRVRQLVVGHGGMCDRLA